MGVSFLESRRPRVDLDPKTPMKASIIVIEQIEPQSGTEIRLTFTITESFPVKISYFLA
jgi:hypothetical protein